MIIQRRGFIGGLVSLLGAPAIVHAGNIMPIKSAEMVMKEALDKNMFGNFPGSGLDPDVIAIFDGMEWRMAKSLVLPVVVKQQDWPVIFGTAYYVRK